MFGQRKGITEGKNFERPRDSSFKNKALPLDHVHPSKIRKKSAVIVTCGLERPSSEMDAAWM